MHNIPNPALDRLEFEFDLNGFAIVRNFLTPEQTDAMNAAVEAKGLTASWPKFHFVESDPLFYDLIFDPTILALCSRWIGPTFRFDHAWGIHYAPGSQSTRENLHAGPYQNQGFFHYSWHNGLPRVSCLLFSFVLKDQPAGEGGLVLLPGSHKLNYPIERHASVDLFDRFYGKDFTAIPTLAQPALNRGDLLIMAEATVHGTAQWQSKTNWRRNLYYKYCYGFMGWVPHDNDVIGRLRARARTELEQRVLERPYVSQQSGNTQDWRVPTLGAGNSLLRPTAQPPAGR